MGWTIREMNPSGERLPAPVQTSHKAHPASLAMGTGSISGVKQPGCGIDHPPSSSAEVKERVELHINSPSGPSWPFLIIFEKIVRGVYRYEL
jgi:hypothetical protein